MKKIVVAGATGFIASQVLPALQERYECVLLDQKSERRDGTTVEGVHIVDLLDTNLDDYREHFVDADGVVNFTYNTPTNRGPDGYFTECKNVDLARNVLEVARQESIPRFVSASSNHSADFYELLYWEKKIEHIDESLPPLSDNLYGWSRQAMEHLGFVYSSGTLGSQMDVVFIRIGGPREADLSRCNGNVNNMVRQLAVYLSVRDIQQLFVKSLETEDLMNEHGRPYQIFYGISGNARAFWPLQRARDVIGYEPEDDSEVKFADQIAEYLVPAQREHMNQQQS
ncbi:MAG: NAD(P)-dependent oxidoreductase [Planctomycetota bacterium]|jgi:nucleoside-diphosphate-sugar epimerase|nr:NAD(P)-dependent oxidoreductase [Planctomycetota bacterium]